MAEIGDEIAPHLARLMQVGRVLKAQHDAAQRLDRAAGDFVDDVMRAVVRQVFRLARTPVGQRAFDGVDHLGPAQDGGEMAPHDALPQQGQRVRIRLGDTLVGVDDNGGKRHGGQNIGNLRRCHFRPILQQHGRRPRHLS